MGSMMITPGCSHLLHHLSIGCGHVVSQWRIWLHGQNELANRGHEADFGRGSEAAQDRT
jgi:hypothetical protein